MRNSWYKKGLVFGIIFLLIGVGISHTYAINIESINKTDNEKETVNNDKLEYIIQIVKSDEIIEHTVYLTEEEANDLENLIDNIKSDFNTAKTEEEINQIYLDSAVLFKDLDILPEDVSINEINQIMAGEDRNIENIRFKNEMGAGIENRLCFVASDTTGTFSIGPILLLTAFALIPLVGFGGLIGLIDAIIDLSQFELLFSLLRGAATLFLFLFFSLAIMSGLSIINIQPVSIGSLITFGISNVIEPPDPTRDYLPSNGWISTFGLNGLKGYTGNFYGHIFEIPLFFTSVYTGIVGFTGISIIKPDFSAFRLGFALNVKVDTSYVVQWR